jgi:hypothetical protein
MSAKKSADGPTQKTLAPNEKDRIDIPIPKRGDFARLVKKAAQPLGPRRTKKKSTE